MNRRSRYFRSLALSVALALCVAVGAAVVSGSLTTPTGFRGWIDEVHRPDGSRGWEHLGDDIRRQYGGDVQAYLAEVAAADWSRLRLAPAMDVRSHDGFVQVQAPLISEPSTVPAFVLERGIVHGVCDGPDPVAIGVWEDRRPFADGRLNVSGETGGQARCNDAFQP